MTKASNKSDKALLEVDSLVSTYGQVEVLHSLSLNIKEGETVALIGANGAGKTTFLKTLSGIQPVRSGKVFFDGNDITSIRADLRVRKGISQSPEGRVLFGPLSVKDNLLLGAHTRNDDQVEKDLAYIYSLFPVLEEKSHLSAGSLSGGQQQMVAIGRALMAKPKLLLLDEPSMGLAPILVEEIFNVVRSLKEEGITILLVEQNAYEALAISDRAYVLETGNIVMSGESKQIIDSEEIKNAYLGI